MCVAFNRPVRDRAWPPPYLSCAVCPNGVLGGAPPHVQHLCPAHQGHAIAFARRAVRERQAALTIQFWWRAWLKAGRAPEGRGKRWWIIDP